MLPTKIKTKLLKEFGVSFYQFPPKSVIHHLTKYDSLENLKIALAFNNTVTKIIYNNPDGKVDTTFARSLNRRRIIRSVRNNGKRNYHDYLTTFKFVTDHPIYDLIVTVNYVYVYD